MIPDKAALLEAHERIKPYVHRTPVLTSTMINDIAGADLFFKCDNFQKGGAYKIRGATNALLSMDKSQRSHGVATHSSGNFAQALSIAARSLEVPAYIVMPENAPKVKVAAVKGYGGEVILCPSTLKDREATLEKVLADKDATPVHPSNDIDVILGQGTMSLELLDQTKGLDYIISPIGGGGVGAGACLACHHMSPSTKVVGAEPANADDAYRSLAAGHIMPSVNPDTIADGLRTQLGDKNFPIIHSLIDEIILVQEEIIIAAMRLVWERMKIIIEPSSATSLAAVMTNPDKFRDKRVGLIITGGNVSLDQLPF